MKPTTPNGHLPIMRQWDTEAEGGKGDWGEWVPEVVDICR